MTVTADQLLLYAGALLILFFTPGPVWVALTARALSGGFRQAWPLAVGVTVGDFLWPLLAILGVTWMGWLLIRHAGAPISADGRLTRPGMWAGFAAGVAVIVGNPKAILFYMGVLPGFFDLRVVTAWDIVAICGLSMVIPLMGNLALAAMIDRARRLLTSPDALARVNRIAGALLILVGLVIPFT
jgi:threonine/homoserine/homoserine lactone efflux protein